MRDDSSTGRRRVQRAGRIAAVALTAAVAVVPTATAVASVPTGGATAAAQGTLTSSRPLPAGWGGADRAWYVEYVTDGPTGAPANTSGAVLLPAGTAPAGGWPVIAWDHGTSGLGRDCGPTSKPNAGPDEEITRTLLGRGYAVVVPDYVGLGANAQSPHPYLQTRTEAAATVDLMRAARSVTGDLAPRWAVAGVSQGGHAALATGNMATKRAPELDFRGTAALAPATNIEKAFTLVGPYVPEVPGLEGITAQFAAAVGGLRSAQPDFDVNSYLTPAGVALVDRLQTLCEPDWATAAKGLSLGSLVRKPLLDPEFARRLNDYMAVPVSGYDRPILVTHGYVDTTVPIPLTAALLAEFQAAGTQYRFETYQTDHPGVVDASWPVVLPYLSGILA
ncbi:lipase family protein [Rhodococcus spelaei]|uniref:lipase family protein n=1 Tax=Rhodococcus spelaei TaxID=2546320 RepID=UPI0015EFC54E|nr:lipase family protein [Rhodococcus spelaei]